MTNTNAMNLTTAPAIFEVEMTKETLQVMSDVWEANVPVLTITTIEADGSFKFNRTTNIPAVLPQANATEDDLSRARAFIVKRGKMLALEALVAACENTFKGMLVTVVSGRKVAKGSKGICLKSGVSQFGRWVLVRWDDGKESFINASNCDFEFPFGQEVAEWEALDACEGIINECARLLRPVSSWSVQSAVENRIRFVMLRAEFDLR
jgi:hypothetical protein